MCNVTLDARQLYVASKLRYGQIKSLELGENQNCWFRLLPEPGYRIELQVYRIVDMGQLNQSRCTGGQLEWITSTGTAGTLPGRHNVWTLCGPNERYSPPSLFFSDDDVSPATLLLKSVIIFLVYLFIETTNWAQNNDLLFKCCGSHDVVKIVPIHIFFNGNLFTTAHTGPNDLTQLFSILVYFHNLIKLKL